MKKRYSPIELKDMLKQVIIPTKGKDKVAFRVESGMQVAHGYTSIQASSFGLYVEFSLKQIYIPEMYFSVQGNPHFFIWHPDKTPDVDVLQPRGIIEGTTFMPSRFYIDPKKLFTHGMSLMKIRQPK